MDANIFQRLEQNDPTVTKLAWSHIENREIKLLMKSLSSGNSSLVHLELRGSDIEVEDAEALADIFSSGNSALNYLEIIGDDNGQHFNDELVEALSNGLLVGKSVLKVLKLRYCNISNNGAKALAKVLSSGKSLLTTLKLPTNYIEYEGVSALATAISSGNSQLTHLDISYNTETPGDILPMTEIFSSENSTLIELDIGGNHIGDDEVKAFAEAFSPKNTSLTTLRMGDNIIEQEGAIALARAVLLKWPHLTCLDLWGKRNQIGEFGAWAFADVISSHNSSLTKLYFNGDVIGDSGAQMLEDALLQNGKLVELGAWGDNIEKYLERNRIAQKKAENAVIAILILSKRKSEKQKREEEHKEDLLEPLKTKSNYDTVFEKLLRETGSQQGESYLIDMAKELWTTRYDPAWWTVNERIEAGLEQRSNKRLKTVQRCIAGQLCDKKAILMEAYDQTQVFCSSYCQFMHYTGAPDLRGMNVKQIKQILSS